MTEEYGLPAQPRSAFRAAGATFSAFAICGVLPLLPFVFGFANALAISIVFTGVVFFAIGSVKSLWSTTVWWRSGLSTLLVGSVAAALAYAVGLCLKTLVH